MEEQEQEHEQDLVVLDEEVAGLAMGEEGGAQLRVVAVAGDRAHLGPGAGARCDAWWRGAG